MGALYCIDRYCVSCNEVYGELCTVREPLYTNKHEDGRVMCVEYPDKEDELCRYIEKAGWHAKRRATAAREDTVEVNLSSIDLRATLSAGPVTI